MRQTQWERIQSRLEAVNRRFLMRPLRSEEIVDVAIHLVRSRGLAYLGMTLVPSMGSFLTLWFMGGFLVPQLFLTEEGSTVRQEFFEVATTLGLTLFVALPLLATLFSFMSGAVTAYTCGHLAAKPISEAEAIRTSARKLGALVLTKLYSFGPTAVMFIIVLGLLFWSAVTPDNNTAVLATMGIATLMLPFCLIPLIVYGIRGAVVPSVLVMENRKGPDAYKRSKALMAQAPFHGAGSDVVTTLSMSVFFIVVSVVTGLLVLIATLDPGSYIKAIVSSPKLNHVLGSLVYLAPAFLGLWVCMIIWNVSMAVVYVDRRIRLEGLDIELLSRELDAS